VAPDSTIGFSSTTWEEGAWYARTSSALERNRDFSNVFPRILLKGNSSGSTQACRATGACVPPGWEENQEGVDLDGHSEPEKVHDTVNRIAMVFN
jgi:hypothetical protein